MSYVICDRLTHTVFHQHINGVVLGCVELSKATHYATYKSAKEYIDGYTERYGFDDSLWMIIDVEVLKVMGS